MEILCKKCNSKNLIALDVMDKISVSDNSITINRVYNCKDCHRRSEYKLKGSFLIDSAELIPLPEYIRSAV